MIDENVRAERHVLHPFGFRVHDLAVLLNEGAHVVVVAQPRGRQARRGVGDIVAVEDESEIRQLNALLEKRVLDRTVELVRSNEQLKGAEAGLRESEARCQAMFEAATIGIALVNMEGRFLESNSALKELFGYSEEEIEEVGHGWPTP